MNVVVPITAGLLVFVLALRVRPAAHARLVAPDGSAQAHRLSRTPRARGSAAAVNELVDVLDAIARDVRTGTSLAAAVRAALDSHPPVLAPVRRLLDAEVSLPGALHAVAGGRAPLHVDERLAVQTLLACSHAGGATAPPIEHAAAALRERRAWRLERDAHAAQARLSAAVMTLLPVAFGLWSAATSTTVRHAYASPVVALAASVGLVVNGVGWVWMRRLVRGVP